MTQNKEQEQWHHLKKVKTRKGRSPISNGQTSNKEKEYPNQAQFTMLFHLSRNKPQIFKTLRGKEHKQVNHIKKDKSSIIVSSYRY